MRKLVDILFLAGLLTGSVGMYGLLGWAGFLTWIAGTCYWVVHVLMRYIPAIEDARDTGEIPD